MNRHYSTGWPNALNMLNLTMLNSVEWKCWIRLVDALITIIPHNVERCWMKMLNRHHSIGWPNAFSMLNSTMLNSVKWKCCIDIIQQGGQTRLACWIQQCWTVLNGNVESTSFNRVAKHVQHVVFNNVEGCWMKMSNQHHLTGWPNVFNMLYSTMLNGVEWKCWIRLVEARWSRQLRTPTGQVPEFKWTASPTFSLG